MGPCAKTVVICFIHASNGRVYQGSNWCMTPQKVCPRQPGEDYAKCKTICNQVGHAEMDALRIAGKEAAGSAAVIKGHTYYCRECQEALFAAGVKTLSVQ